VTPTDAGALGANTGAGLEPLVPSSLPSPAVALPPPVKLGGTDLPVPISEPVPVAYPVPVLCPVLMDVSRPGPLPAVSPLFVVAGSFCPQAPAAKTATENAASHSRVQFVMTPLQSNSRAAAKNRPIL
jgi:hypothetical protein